MNSALESQPTISHKPVLIIDKKGVLGLELAKKIAQDYVVILVTGREVALVKNLIVIPYKRKIPVIPDNTFRQIIVVSYGDPETFSLLSPLSRKAEESKTRIAFILGLRNCSEALYAKFEQRFPYVSLFVTGDVFGGELWEFNLISDFLSQIKKYGKVVIPNTGLYKTYPVFFDDVISGVIKEIFLEGLTKRLYCLFPPYPVTALSIARVLQQIHPEIGVDFHKTKERARVVVLPKSGDFILPNPYSLDKRFGKIDIAVKKEPTFLAPSNEGLRYRKPLLLVIFGFMLLIAMPFIATAVFSFFGVILLSAGKSELEKGRYDKAEISMVGAKNAFAIASETADSATNVASFIGLREPMDEVGQRIAVGGQVASAGELLLHSYGRFIAIQKGRSASPKEDFASGMNDLRHSMVLAHELSSNPKTPEGLRKTLASYNPIMQLVTATGDLYPDLLGFNGKKVYLALFQNNMELRPGGGFIGSYGLLTVEGGRVVGFTIHNVYDADGQLKGHIDPPFALRRYLGAKHLFLRDSNFSVDFPKNAAQAAYLLELETGVKPDGVFAVDMNFLRSLIEVVGPISVPTYNEVITPENVYLVTQRHAQNNSFPGSKQKQTFLKALFEGLLRKISQKGGINPNLVQRIASGITGKHVMLVVLDKGAQNVLTLNNLSGSLWDNRKSNPATINDVFGINEANLGENKVNYYLQRTFDLKIFIDSVGAITNEATITYNNTAKEGSEFGGPYKAYIRTLLPEGADLTAIAIDGSPQTLVDAVTDNDRFDRPTFVPPSGMELYSTQEEGKEVIGFYFIVPEHTKKVLTLRYRLAQKAPDNAYAYSLLFLKQPGTEADPYFVTINYPTNNRVVSKSNNLTQNKGSLSAFGPLTGDTLFDAKFAK